MPAPQEDGGLLSKAHLSISVQAVVFIGRERKSRTKKSGGGAVNEQAVSLLALIRTVSVSRLELVSASQIPQLGDLCQLESCVQAGTNCGYLQHAYKETVNM